MKRKQTFGILAGIVVLAAVIVACGESTGATTTGGGEPQGGGGSATSPTEPATATPKPSGHAVGEAVKVGGYTVTVTSFGTYQQGQYDSAPKAGNQYVQAKVSVKNNTGDTQTVSSMISFTLRDAAGVKYTEALVGGAHPPDGTLPDGQTLSGDLVYEVPTNQSTFSFLFQPNPFDTSQLAQWNLKLS